MEGAIYTINSAKQFYVQKPKYLRRFRLLMKTITKSILQGWFLKSIKNQPMVSDAFHLGKCSGTPPN